MHEDVARPQEVRPPASAARLAELLGLPEEEVEEAMRLAASDPAELTEAALAGRDGERLAQVARKLGVDKARLAAALVASDLGRLAAPAAEAVREGAEEALDVAVDLLAESVPRFLNRALAVLALGGLALVALGGLAFADQSAFEQALAWVAGGALLALGVGMFWLAWRLHEATATVRVLARLARRWRERRR